jgi:uncharacterized membrane protein YraQ (UPF0718 family)
MRAVDAIEHALAVAGSMTWQITWSLILGFTLSAFVQALVRRSTVVRLLGDDRPVTLARATGLGAASSSCSYAAVALARSLFRKGASFTAAMVFEIASTNLVIELGIILALLISWQFTVAEFVGGPIMIVLLAVAFRIFVRQQLIDEARRQADRGLAGSMEGHAAMDMSITTAGSFWRRLFSREGYTSVSHIFVMEWAAVVRDVVIGLLIAGAVGAWVPDTFWQHLFLTGHPLGARLWGPLIGPVISVLSFVCSIGNVPLAGVLWNGGISFGGPDHHPDPAHLPEVLRHPDDARAGRTVLRHHGAGRIHRRVRLHRAGPGPVGPYGQSRGDRDRVELHHIPEHRVPRGRRRAAGAFLPVRGPFHAQDDGWPTGRGRPRSRRPRCGRRPG